MAVNRCPKCKTEYAQSHAFCPRCGTRMEEISPKAISKPRRTRRSPLGEWLILILIAAATVFVYNLAASTKQAPKPSQSAMIPETTDSFTTAVNLGNNFMDRGMYDHAIPQYERALDFDSLQPDIMVDLGACYHALGENEEAIFQFDRALAQDSLHAVALFNMGVAQLSNADTTAAKMYWNRFLKVAGEMPQADMVRRQLQEL
jgi:tetratricopeptide (TPR) repeat protein